MKNPHVWINGNGLPLCRFCGINSLDAQSKQPETKGAGPCPLNLNSLTMYPVKEHV